MLALLPLALTASSQYQLESALHEVVPCGDETTEGKLRELMHDALDEGFRDAVKGAFEIWMKDDTDQPARAARRIRGAANAYIRSQKALAAWKMLRC